MSRSRNPASRSGFKEGQAAAIKGKKKLDMWR